MHLTIEQLVTEIVAETGHGVAIWKQGEQYLAACLDAQGRISDPRSWHPHDTVHSALDSLLESFSTADRINKHPRTFN